MTMNNERMVVVSNRLPVVINRTPDGVTVEPASGGLVTALRPLLNDCAGVWIGWTGTDASPEIDGVLEAHSQHSNFALKPVFMTPEERSRFYCGFSNEVLWPLFHDLQSRCNFDPSYWDTYLTVNYRFAETAAREAQPGDLVWVHDYHLMSVALGLRRLGIQERLAYFHHIPFPGPDIFEKLPWREEILTALLDFDVVGFQTLRDRRNFADCLRQFVKAAEIRGHGDHLIVEEPGRNTLVGAFPISIDFEEFAHGASDNAVSARAAGIVRSVGDSHIILGVDRLDYTKGIPERLAAFRHLLKEHTELHRKITLVQVVVPSREEIPKYSELKALIERWVSEINGHFSEPGWVPVHYIHRHIDRAELLAYYRAADVALVTPLKDGMNLVSKEYCAARVNNDGVLILSEFAGAAFQLHRGALLVNPYHTRAVAEAIRRACEMPLPEQKKRMRKSRALIRRRDIYWWRDAFCSCRDQAWVAERASIPAAVPSAATGGPFSAGMARRGTDRLRGQGVRA
ncbi:MAG TPA: trehalose-6-phosphate synthase [Terriglobales bacterium]|nr:trehalose-6-phosphate synthase [Terriglobales bacterium]